MNLGAGPNLTPEELFLVDLAQWLARRTQYAATHPSCASIGATVHGSLTRALGAVSPLVYGILKDGVLMGEVPATHRAVLTRIAPHLHARGAQVVRFAGGTTLDDLNSLVETLTLPVQTIFDRGGLVALLVERGVSKIQIDEIAHDIDPDEDAEQRRRKELRSFFAEALRALRAGRQVRGLTGEQLLDLLEDPPTAILILESDPAGVTEAVAGLCYLVQKEEARSGRVLFPKLRVILMMLAPASHAAVLVGFPPLLGNFRAALAWAFGKLDEEDLASFLVPSLRAHATEVDVPLYALSVAVPHDGTRYSTLRLVSLRLHDLPAADAELLTELAKPIDDCDSFREERVCLGPEAMRALAMKTMFPSTAGEPLRADALAPLDPRRSLHDLLVLASKRSTFAQVCERLPQASAKLSDGGAHEAVVGMLHGLNDAGEGARAAAESAMRQIATGAIVGRLLDDLDRLAADLDAENVARLVPTVSLLVKVNPTEVWARLEKSENATMQRMLLDGLAHGGPELLPLLRSKIRTTAPTVLLFVVALLPRVGGTTRDLAAAARHPNEKVRAEVLRSLRTLHPDETTMDVLVSYLEDASQDIRTTARSMLRAELLTPQAITTLERLADDPNQQEALRRRIVEVLGRSPSEAAADALFRLLQPRSLLELGTIREAAAVALRGSRAPNATKLFDEGLQSSVRRVRKACERAERGGTG